MTTGDHKFSVLWLIALSLVVLTTFAAVTEIDQSVRATGQIVSGSRTQVVQAVDGGMLSAIHVREGDAVKAGQVLATLESDRPAAARDQAKAEVASKRIALKRARAELIGAEPDFGTDSQEYPKFVAAQRGLRDQRRRGLEDELASNREALRLAREELRMNEQLFNSGDIGRTEVMRAQRQMIDVEARMAAVRNKFLQDTRVEVARLEEELAASEHRLEDRLSTVDHTVLKAPLDGIVKLLRTNTVGGVLKPGDELMQVSPSGDELLVEIKVNPQDIGQLRTELAVAIRLDAFDSGQFGSVRGRVRYISPDTLSEQGVGGQVSTYYRVQVELDWEETQRSHSNFIRKPDLVPGMTATADVLAGKRSVLTFLAKPILKAFSGALTQR